MEEKQNAALGTAPLGKLMVKFALPCTISLLVGALYNIVDQIFIGWGVGYLGNGATNVVFPLTVLALGLAVMIGDGACSYVSICFGKNRQEDADCAVGSAVTLSVLVGVLVAGFYAVFQTPILLLFGASENTIGYARQYLIPVVIIGALPTLLALSARKRRACVALLVLLFGLLLTLGMLVCQRHLQSVAMQPLPFVWLSRRLGSGGYLLVALCLYAAALSTLCAMLCAMANLLPRGLKTGARLILSALLCAALARVGFGRIVQSGYPILGALCAALLLLLALPARQDASMSAR